MNTEEIRGQIHEYIDQADERMLRIIHSIMEGDLEQEPTVPDWHYEEVERRMQALLSGESKSYTWEEVKENTRKAFNK